MAAAAAEAGAGGAHTPNGKQERWLFQSWDHDEKQAWKALREDGRVHRLVRYWYDENKKTKAIWQVIVSRFQTCVGLVLCAEYMRRWFHQCGGEKKASFMTCDTTGYKPDNDINKLSLEYFCKPLHTKYVSPFRAHTPRYPATPSSGSSNSNTPSPPTRQAAAAAAAAALSDDDAPPIQRTSSGSDAETRRPAMASVMASMSEHICKRLDTLCRSLQSMVDAVQSGADGRGNVFQAYASAIAAARQKKVSEPVPAAAAAPGGLTDDVRGDEGEAERSDQNREAQGLVALRAKALTKANDADAKEAAHLSLKHAQRGAVPRTSRTRAGGKRKADDQLEPEARKAAAPAAAAASAAAAAAAAAADSGAAAAGSAAAAAPAVAAGVAAGASAAASSKGA